jgi:hypothetical protein
MVAVGMCSTLTAAVGTLDGMATLLTDLTVTVDLSPDGTVHVSTSVPWDDADQATVARFDAKADLLARTVAATVAGLLESGRLHPVVG